MSKSEKEDPKEVIQKDDVFICPSCKRTICNDVNYCCECGQRLDWSILEELIK